MADKKISQLTPASTPLAGTEELPVVQGGTTKKVSVANLTAGRSASVSGLTVSGGTANGVAYLNASNVLTTGTTFVFNGTAFGFGTAPKAWAGVGTYAIQRGSSSLFEYGSHNTILGSNYYFDGSANKYINNGKATYYQQFDGGHSWSTAGSGTADGTVSFSTGMTLDENRDLSLSAGSVKFSAAGKGLEFSGDNSIVWRCGTGTPEGAVTAPVGSLFTRTDGGANTTLYVKESGAGNTGWVAK